jgi:malate synthase
MKTLSGNINVSEELYNFIKNICNERGISVENVFEDFSNLVEDFSKTNKSLLSRRDNIQSEIDSYFKETKGSVTTKELVNKLTEIGYIEDCNIKEGVSISQIDDELHPMAGPQLVVPADKANMVLNAANARWQSLYDSLYVSNIIDENISGKNREAEVIKYTNEFLDKIVKFESATPWKYIINIKYDDKSKKIYGIKSDGESVVLTGEKVIGITLDGKNLNSIILENNGLKVEITLDGNEIKDVFLESAITYIIDLEDASISAPENKYEGYRILKGIHDGTLECEVRGETRKINEDSSYICLKTMQEKTLKRTSLALVRDVGPHMMADKEIITINGKEVPEKILDCFVTSFIGYRYHVAPKMHGKKEVALNVEMFDKINEMLELPKNANKIGIMNEEMMTNAQLASCIHEARDVIFFTNTGFLDYTGSFIDLMMHKGAIAPYRELSSKLYKTSYEKHNVNVSLELNVPQIGAGMWAAIKDMKGLLNSKEEQVKGLTDTGWSPSPIAAGIHAMAFHVFGDVRQMQADYKNNISHVNIEDLFDFPKADIKKLDDKDVILNLDFAIHGLLAYAEPWVRRSIGCSGVKELSGEPLMEDRATARIKAAFVRNWLLHELVSPNIVKDSIVRMSQLVDEQNSQDDSYKPLTNNALLDNNWEEVAEPVRAVYEVIFNPKGLKSSYVEPYFYPANRRCKINNFN